jgi:hypothetical protein
MKKALSVALLDGRRLGFGLVSAGLVGGLIPSFASGLGGSVPAESVLVLVFVSVGIACGGYFGNDFTDGRSSFFFARPLPSGTLIAGRLAGLAALSTVTFAAFMASYWISSRERSGFSLFVLNPTHARVLTASFTIALFLALAVAAHGRGQRSDTGLRGRLKGFLRLGSALGLFILTFGLFADLAVRAYFNNETPIRLFFNSGFIAVFIASLAAIVAGRTEGLRIARIQNGVMAGYLAFASIVVTGAWTYVLHPGPGAIEAVLRGTQGSPDGRSAYVVAKVSRGDSVTFKPVFVLDIASGQLQRLDVDPYAGPWLSADGGTMVWSEATPFFFRPLWRYLYGATSFRVRSGASTVETLAIPRKVPDGLRGTTLALGFGMIDRVLPSSGGDEFAVVWGHQVAFTSRSRGELPDVDLGPGRPSVIAGVYLPSGSLRVATALQEGAIWTLRFLDIDPGSGKVANLSSMEVGPVARVQFDATGTRALLVSGSGMRASLSLVTPGGPSPTPTELLGDSVNPGALFLADGRIAATAGAFEKRAFRIFSAAGKPVLDVPMDESATVSVRSEMFPGVLAISLGARFGQQGTGLVDAGTGATVRRLPGVLPVASASDLTFSSAPPPGSAAARLLLAGDGTLYELPSLTAEPRLLLPQPGR